MTMMLSRRILAARLSSLRLTRSFDHLAINEDAQSKVAVVSMRRKPVNSLSFEMLTELTTSIDKLEKERKVKGVIITSSFPGNFCAGLDIAEMSRPNEERLARFWHQVQELWLRLFGSPLATVAAINVRFDDILRPSVPRVVNQAFADLTIPDPPDGNSPAGGCLMSLMCDYRVMASGRYVIGLNETQLGIPPPFWILETMARVVGTREAEHGLSRGVLYSADEALQRGLVDQLVPRDEVLTTAQEQIQQWLQTPDAARRAQKQMLRADTMNRLLARREEDVKNFCKMILAEETQANINGYLDALKARTANKKSTK